MPSLSCDQKIEYFKINLTRYILLTTIFLSNPRCSIFSEFRTIVNILEVRSISAINKDTVKNMIISVRFKNVCHSTMTKNNVYVTP